MEEICYPEIGNLRHYVDKVTGNTQLKINMRAEISNLEKRIRTQILFLLEKKIDTKMVKNIQFKHVKDNFVYNEKLY